MDFKKKDSYQGMPSAVPTRKDGFKPLRREESSRG
jgi:hypothetical protein